MKFRGFAVIPAVAAIAASTILFSATPSDAKAEKIRFRCKAETATLQVDARYQEITTKKNTREQFRAHLEGSGTGLVAGAVVSVLVGIRSWSAPSHWSRTCPARVEEAAALRQQEQGQARQEVRRLFPAQLPGPAGEEAWSTSSSWGGVSVLACDLLSIKVAK